jgi:hypothetical protein
MHNGFVNGVNGRTRDELLNATMFFDLDDARQARDLGPSTTYPALSPVAKLLVGSVRIILQSRGELSMHFPTHWKSMLVAD